MAAMEEQWKYFIACAKDKGESHSMAARFWTNVDTFFGLSLIFLSASVTATALLDGVPKELLAGIGAVSTMLAAAASFLKSADRRQTHEKTSRNFRALMVKMLSCETEKDYEKLWTEFNKEITDEPMMPRKFVKAFRANYTMTPELREIIEEKELTIAQLENQKNQERLAAQTAAENIEENKSESACPSPEKEKWKSIIEIPDIASYGKKWTQRGILKNNQSGEPLV